MKFVRIVAIGHPDAGLVDAACTGLTRELGLPCRIAPNAIDPVIAYSPERNQYHSTMLLEALANLGGSELTVGIAGVDLYIPILTFVFGEARVGAACALVSYHRLLQEFYREKLAMLLRHEAGAQAIAQYDANNTYQYVINREDTHLSWLSAAITSLGGAPESAAPEPRSAG